MRESQEAGGVCASACARHAIRRTRWAPVPFGKTSLRVVGGRPEIASYCVVGSISTTVTPGGAAASVNSRYAAHGRGRCERSVQIERLRDCAQQPNSRSSSKPTHHAGGGGACGEQKPAVARGARLPRRRPSESAGANRGAGSVIDHILQQVGYLVSHSRIEHLPRLNGTALDHPSLRIDHAIDEHGFGSRAVIGENRISGGHLERRHVVCAQRYGGRGVGYRHRGRVGGPCPPRGHSRSFRLPSPWPH